jgi:hypothetical protein
MRFVAVIGDERHVGVDGPDCSPSDAEGPHERR